MKINYGKFKKRNLIIGKNKQMRPTQSIVKSIIFNSIDSNNKVVLDLFAGTGSLGFESASLGAKEVIWIDNNKDSILAIKENISIFKLDPKMYRSFRTDFRTALKKIEYKVDHIFLDPPFIAEKYYNIALINIYEKDILSKNGVIIIESPKLLNFQYDGMFSLLKKKKVGKKIIIFLEKNKITL